VLLPAAMKLLGDWNWYLPSWLEWLPKGPSLGEEPAGGRPAAPAFEPGSQRRHDEQPQPAQA
jgi:RND superfamily putative drug exporter